MATDSVLVSEIVRLPLDNLCCLCNLPQNQIIERIRVLTGIGTPDGEVGVFPFDPILCTILFRM